MSKNEEELYGFIPASVVGKLQSSDYEVRVDASRKILDLVKAADIRRIDMDGLLDFLQMYVLDENYTTAQNVAQTISAVVGLCFSSGEDLGPYLSQIIRIILLQFGDRRRIICQLGQTLFIDLLTTYDQFEIMSELVSLSNDENPKVIVEIFRCIANLVNQKTFDPQILLQFPFFIDSALLAPQSNVRQSVLWCMNSLKQNRSDAYHQIVGLLSRDAAAVLGNGTLNVTTTGTRIRTGTTLGDRPVNTAGQIDYARTKSYHLARLGSSMTRQYQRPSLPSGKGARTINMIAGMSRPVTWNSLNDATFSSHVEHEKVVLSSKTFHSGFPGDDVGDVGSSIEDTDADQRRLVDVKKLRSRSQKSKTVELGANWMTLYPEAKGEDGGLSSVAKPREAKTDLKWITSSPSKGLEETDPNDSPAKTAGLYNIGNDVDFDVLDPSPQPVRRKSALSFGLRMKTRKAVTEKPKEKRLLTDKTPPKAVRLPAIMEKLRSQEWTDQNEAVTQLISNQKDLMDQIGTNLRDLMASLLDCAGSLRSTLAKNALTCILSYINHGSLVFDPVADFIAGSLLSLIAGQKSKHFIAELSGECFAALMKSISPSKACDIVKNEYKRKHDSARAQVSACIVPLVSRLPDSSSLLKVLAVLAGDRDPEVRKNAKTALGIMKSSTKNFASLVDSMLDSSERTLVMEI